MPIAMLTKAKNALDQIGGIFTSGAVISTKPRITLIARSIFPRLAVIAISLSALVAARS